jgi:hypothetical protein
LSLYNNTMTGSIPSTLCSTSTFTRDVYIDCDELTCTCCQGYEGVYDTIACDSI